MTESLRAAPNSPAFVMNSILCPACGSAASVALESIYLDEQHSWYAPRDPMLQQRLTEQAKKSTPGYTMRRCSQCSLQLAEPMIAPNPAWYELAYQALELYPGTRWEFDQVLAACQSAASTCSAWIWTRLRSSRRLGSSPRS
jgi:rRNA maturation protein Nop10